MRIMKLFCSVQSNCDWLKVNMDIAIAVRYAVPREKMITLVSGMILWASTRCKPNDDWESNGQEPSCPKVTFADEGAAQEL